MTTTGTMMITNRMMMPMTMHMRIFMSFHHIFFRTRLAPRRKPWAETARLSGTLPQYSYRWGMTGGPRTGLVLETVQSRTAVGNLVDVFAHYPNRIVDLLHNGSAKKKKIKKRRR